MLYTSEPDIIDIRYYFVGQIELYRRADVALWALRWTCMISRIKSVNQPFKSPGIICVYIFLKSYVFITVTVKHTYGLNKRHADIN